jgi:hypothetical protein
MPALLSWARWADGRDQRTSCRRTSASSAAACRACHAAPIPEAAAGPKRPAYLLRFNAEAGAVHRREPWRQPVRLARHAPWGVPVHVVGFVALPLLVWAAMKFPPLFVHTAIMGAGLITITIQLTAPGNEAADPITHLAALFLFLPERGGADA